MRPSPGSLSRALRIATGLLLLSCTLGPATTHANTSTANHAEFEQLEGPFKTGADVTRACLGCHTEAGDQVVHSIHWTWEFDHPISGQQLGKRTVLNNFCGNVATNEPRCTSCHAGYGWTDTASFDFSNQENVDCLVCHDSTGEYFKWPTAAGHPLYEDRIQASKLGAYPESLIEKTDDGKFRHKAPDLAKIAQNIGKPGIQNCGTCHFYGGGGDNVKHGDLSSAQLNATPHVDVHLSKDGAGLVCTDCHTGDGHQWPGSRYLGTVDNPEQARPGFRDTEVLSCDGCHGDRPHDGGHVMGMKLNDHTDRIACQTCHIPTFAKGGVPTKTLWDWSTAGRLDENGKPIKEHDEQGRDTYLSQKGNFEWGEEVVPDYAWWNGIIEYTLLGEKIDPAAGLVETNTIKGSAEDPDSRIYPFKLMHGKQAYDTEHNYMLMSNVFGPETDTAYWKVFDWDKAFTAAMAATDYPYSGNYDFIETAMWWPTTHMVAPADEALKCGHCHDAEGRLANVAGLYIPGRDRFPMTDRIGLMIVAAALAFVVLHGLGRVLTSRRHG